MTNSNWYDNKELYEMIQQLKIEIPELRTAMKETTKIIKKYNGLREEVEKLKLEIVLLKGNSNLKDSLKKDTKKDWQWMFGWIVAVGSLLIAIFK